MSESADAYEEPESVLLLYSGLQDAFIGSVETYGKPPVACYSKKVTIEVLQKDYGLSEDEAYRRYEYEYLQSDYGEATPVFLDDTPIKDVS
tara:strand:+ start:24 stop:296 length:273 start_codon:yes stop_codon:yes gene_type:complete